MKRDSNGNILSYSEFMRKIVSIEDMPKYKQERRDILIDKDSDASCKSMMLSALKHKYMEKYFNAHK